MGEYLNFPGYPLLARPAFSLVFLLFVVLGPFAVAQNQEADLPADTIIEILQSNPDLLEDAKSEIVDQLRARGYSVSEKDITDDRLFGQIRSDDRVRHVMSDELKARGFGAEQAETTQQEGTGNSQPAQQDQNAGPATGTGRGNSSQGQLNDNGNAP